MDIAKGFSKAVFLDRDGVLNDLVDRGDGFMLGGKPFRWTAPFNRKELHLKPNALDALSLIEQKGYLRIMVTNQPDVATGHIEPAEFELMMDVFRTLPIDDIYVCRHAPGAGCACRKPSPKMIIDACGKHQINPALSYMVGDSESDVAAGRAAGTHTILVSPYVYTTTGAGHRVLNIMEAAQFIP